MSLPVIAEPTAAPASDDSKQRPWVVLCGALLLGLAADYLIVSWAPALGMLVFLFAVAIGAFAASRPSERADRHWLVLAGFVLAACLIPLLTSFGFLSLIIGIGGLCAFTLIVSGTRVTSPSEAGRRAARLLLSGPFTLPPAIIRTAFQPVAARPSSTRQWSGWIVPIVFGALFLFLFQSANPIIETWLSKLDLFAWLAAIDPWRVGFVLFMMSLCWPFLQGRLPQSSSWRLKRSTAAETRGSAAKTGPTAADHLLGHAAIVRSLVLFNALFAVQTALDAAYLWGGHALPDGMTYAAYAHRGAYPLVATALIAAAFTLVALRRGCVTETSLPVRNLILLWVGQNVLLVASSILRLDLYVSEYSLTMLRVAAFVWMGLVAMGLVLIMVRVLRGHGNAWLVKWNLVALAFTLYACSLVNFPALIAHYNVGHSQEISGNGPPLDVYYLASLGPQVIPALDRFRLEQSRQPGDKPGLADECAFALERRFLATMDNWRSWSLQNARLKKYLKNRQVLEPRNGHTRPR